MGERGGGMEGGVVDGEGRVVGEWGWERGEGRRRVGGWGFRGWGRRGCCFCGMEVLYLQGDLTCIGR